MRSLSRAVVASALSLPLIIAGAGFASACPSHDGGHKKDGHASYTKHDKDTKWNWGWNWTHLNVSDNDKQVINAGIIG